MAGKVYGTTAWKNSDPDSSLPLVHCASAQGLAVNVLLLLPLTGVRFYQLFCGYWFLIRPKTIVFGRTYVLLWFFFFFFSPRNLRAPSADRCEILHDACCCVQFYNPGPKFWGSLPKKFLGAKNMQNLARFRSTSKFGGEFLRNGWRYSKSVSYLFDNDSSRVRWNKSGEVWSSNLGDLDASLYPPKALFSEEHILAPRGCCAPKFLHALENN